MSENRELIVRPIGRVTAGAPWPPGDTPRDPATQEAEIAIDPAWEPALEGLDAFSHVWVVWWLDRSALGPDLPLLIHPQGRQELPVVGLFATRSPHRPNPVAITAVRLLARHGNRLHVLGLDACQDTPVLDIKPYLRRGDLLADANVPPWLAQLWHTLDREAGSE